MSESFIVLPASASLGGMQSIPSSRGSSHIVSATLYDNHPIDPRFFNNPLDLDIIATHHLLALEKFLSMSSQSANIKSDSQCVPPIPLSRISNQEGEYLLENSVLTYDSLIKVNQEVDTSRDN